MCSRMVFHCAAVLSVGYRSGWHLLQCIEYNSAPVSRFGAGLAFGFEGADWIFWPAEFSDWDAFSAVPSAPAINACGAKTVRKSPSLTAVWSRHLNCLIFSIFCIITGPVYLSAPLYATCSLSNDNPFLPLLRNWKSMPPLLVKKHWMEISPAGVQPVVVAKWRNETVNQRWRLHT